MLRILKFGGTSMGTKESITQCGEIVAAAARRGSVVVVVSALAGVTNELIALMDLAKREQTEQVQERVHELERRHRSICEGFVPRAQFEELWTRRMVPLFEKLNLILTGTSFVGDMSDRSSALVCAFGERLSSQIMHCALSALGCKSEVRDASSLVCTDAQYLEANVDFSASKKRFRSAVVPLLKKGTIVVIPGFIGGESSGHTTLLGRGGSDYSASIAGICLGADAVEIWTDVDGILSADPRRVKKGVRTWKTIGLAAVSEMAHSGAKVLHPKTITAAVHQQIPVIVRNTFNRSHPGTTVVPKDADKALRGVVTQGGQMILHFTEPSMLASAGFIHRVGSVFALHNIPIDVCTTSEISFTCSIAESDFSARLLKEFQSFAGVKIFRHLAKVAVIGNQISDDPRILERVMHALHSIKLYAVSIGSSFDNITLLVDETNAERALTLLHASLFPV